MNVKSSFGHLHNMALLSLGWIFMHQVMSVKMTKKTLMNPQIVLLWETKFLVCLAYLPIIM